LLLGHLPDILALLVLRVSVASFAWQGGYRSGFFASPPASETEFDAVPPRGSDTTGRST
jgi:hypothetical protein